MRRRGPMRRLRTLFWKIPVEQEVDEEIAFHLEMQTSRYIAEGMTPADAREAALRRFGDPQNVRQECRTIGKKMEVEMRRAELRHELRQDVGFALRLLRNSPLFTVIALFTLAVADGVTVMELAIPRTKYDTAARKRQFYSELRDRLATLPGVQQATAVYPLPMGGKSWSGSFEVEGRQLAPGEPEPHAEYAVALPGYFRAMRISLRDGREFTEQDTEGAPEVVIVDELLARRYWPGERAIGKRLDIGTVIGVVAHVRNAGPQEEGEPQLYKPFLQWPQTPMFVVARADGGAAALAPALRGAVRAVDSNQPITDLRSMQSLVHGAVARQRFNMLLLSIFAAVALVLAIVGLYGMMAGLVSQRLHEIGIRLALGGKPGDALRLILQEGMKVVLAGLLIGLAAAAALSRTVSGLLFSTGSTDPLTYGVIAALVLLISLAATWVPARRATRVDPLAALRDA